jgi:hypothetical protein
MKTSAVFFVALALTSFCGKSSAQAEIQFTLAEQPNRHYVRLMSTTGKMSMDLRGNPELIKRAQSRGISFPHVFQTEQIHRLVVKNGAMQSDGKFPTERTLEEQLTRMFDKDGQQVSEKRSALVGLRARGKSSTASAAFDIEDIIGLPADADKALIAQIFASMSNSLAGPPAKTVKVGDTFAQTFDFPIPMPDGRRFQLAMTLTYTLVSLDKQIATLNTIGEFAFKVGEKVDGFRMEGGSKGTMTYNTVRKEIVHSQDELTGSFSFIDGQTSMSLWMTNTSLSSVEDRSD